MECNNLTELLIATKLVKYIHTVSITLQVLQIKYISFDLLLFCCFFQPHWNTYNIGINKWRIITYHKAGLEFLE